MPAENVVAIHPHKAATLVRALQLIAAELDAMGVAAGALLREAIEDEGPAVRLRSASAWMEDQAAQLHATLVEVMAWYGDGRRVPLDGVDVWLTPYDAAFDDPVEASRAAHEAQLALVLLLGGEAEAAGLPAAAEGGDAEAAGRRFDELLDRWGGDATFATVLVSSLGAASVVELLRHRGDLAAALGAADPSGATDAVGGRGGRIGPDVVGLGDRRGERAGAADGEAWWRAAALDRLWVVLARASVVATMPFTVQALGVEADRLGAQGAAGRGAIGVDGSVGDRSLLFGLFVPGAHWSDEVLVAAIDEVVVPANRVAASTGVRPGGLGVDPRLALLGLVASRPWLARRVLASSDLDGLLGAGADYSDGGQVLSDVLIVGTRPDRGGDPSGAARRVIEWVARHRDLPPQAHDRLPELVEPYLGSFRSAQFDTDTAVDNPLPGLAAPDRVGFLRYVADSAVAVERLRHVELAWAFDRYSMLTSGPFDGAGIATVASVDAEVAEGYRRYERRVARGVDESDGIRRGFVVWLLSKAADELPAGLDIPATAGLNATVDHVDPPTRAAEELHDREAWNKASDHALIEWVLLSAMWRQRSTNHAFDRVTVPEPLLDPASDLLRPLHAMDREQQLAYLAWLEVPAVKQETHWTELASWDHVHLADEPDRRPEPPR